MAYSNAISRSETFVKKLSLILNVLILRSLETHGKDVRQTVVDIVCGALDQGLGWRVKFRTC